MQLQMYHKIHALLNNLLVLAVKAVQYNYEDKTHVTNKSSVSVPMYLNTLISKINAMP